MHGRWDDIATTGPQATAARQRTEALLAEAARLRLAREARSGRRHDPGAWAAAVAAVLFAPMRPWDPRRTDMTGAHTRSSRFGPADPTAVPGPVPRSL
jgi:hypothetical protein